MAEPSSLLSSLLKVRTRLLKLAQSIGWLGPLLARITVGVVFMGTGWGKLHSIPDVTQFFTELHIPAPHFQAVLVASTEFFGGVLLLIGLFTRLAALPLAFTMVIAILTAKLDKIEGVTDLLGAEEFSYFVLFVWLAMAGPGRVSIDHLLGKALDRRG